MTWSLPNTSFQQIFQNFAPYDHSIGQQFIADIIDWWHPETHLLASPNSLSARDSWSTTWRWPVQVVSLMEWSCDAHLAALRAPEGIALPKTSPKWELGREVSLFQPSRNLQGALTLRNWVTVGEVHFWFLAIPFTRLSNAHFTYDGPWKNRAASVQRAGTYSSSEGKKRYSSFHKDLR